MRTTRISSLIVICILTLSVAGPAVAQVSFEVRPVQSSRDAHGTAHAIYNGSEDLLTVSVSYDGDDIPDDPELRILRADGQEVTSTTFLSRTQQRQVTVEMMNDNELFAELRTGRLTLQLGDGAARMTGAIPPIGIREGARVMQVPIGLDGRCIGASLPDGGLRYFSGACSGPSGTGMVLIDGQPTTLEPFNDGSATFFESSDQTIVGAFENGSLSVKVGVNTADFDECLADEGTLCLNKGRFSVGVEWETAQGQTGTGTAIPRTDDSGEFWFFDSDNIEMVVKVLDACGSQFNSYWVFAAGLTNVEVEITVTDTRAGTTKTYQNPLGTPFEPILDTNAFQTCP